MSSETRDENDREARRHMQDEALRTSGGFRMYTEQGPPPPPGQAPPPPAGQAPPPPSWQAPPTSYAPPYSFSSQEHQQTGQAHTFSYEQPRFTTTNIPTIVPTAQQRGLFTTADERDAAILRAQLPACFSQFSDKYILSQHSDAIYRLIREEKAAEQKGAKSLEARQHQNFLAAVANPVTIPASQDNREALFHPGRVLAGAAVPVQRHWHEMRNVWGADGVPATANYDCDSVGIAGCVTARGWEALHHPGSGELSIKLFTVNNMVQSGTGSRTVSLAGEEGFIIKESWKEVQSIEELKKALDTIVTASMLCSQGNFSYKVLQTFLNNNEWFEKDLAGYKRAQVVADFCDHVFKLNADAWIRNADFNDGPKLLTIWTNWWGSRKTGLKQEAGSSGRGSNSSHTYKSTTKQGGGYNTPDSRAKSDPNKIPFITAKPQESSVCKRFVDGYCTKKHYECIIKTKVGARRLYHVCTAKKKDAAGVESTCLGPHHKKDHK